MEADGAFAGELRPGARAAGCVGVAPVSAKIARVLKGIRGAICESRDMKASEYSATPEAFLLPHNSW